MKSEHQVVEISKMNTKRYTNGVKWLNAHGFSASPYFRAVYRWANKDGVHVVFSIYSSKWWASLNGWEGDEGTTPKSAIGKLRKFSIQRKDELLKAAQSQGEVAALLGKVLEEEEKDGR